MRFFNNIIYPDRKPLHTADEYQKMSESELMNQYKNRYMGKTGKVRKDLSGKGDGRQIR